MLLLLPPTACVVFFPFSVPLFLLSLVPLIVSVARRSGEGGSECRPPVTPFGQLDDAARCLRLDTLTDRFPPGIAGLGQDFAVFFGASLLLGGTVGASAHVAAYLAAVMDAVSRHADGQLRTLPSISLPATLCVGMSWAASALVLLDWDRPWQVVPAPQLRGAALGLALGAVAQALIPTPRAKAT